MENEGVKWTPQRERVAVLVAEDQLTDEEIAKQEKITVRTLYRWKSEKGFQDKVDEIIAEILARVRRHGIARIDKRVQSQDERWRKALAVIKARAKRYGDEIDEAPLKALAGEEIKRTVPEEARTGLIVDKPVYTKDGTLVGYEWVADTALMAEIRALEKHSAEEMGQWKAKDGTGTTVIIKAYQGTNLSEMV